VTVETDGRGQEVMIEALDGSGPKTKGYLYHDDQGKLIVSQKDEDSVNNEVDVALVKFSGTDPSRTQIMDYTSKLGAEKYPSGSDKTHDFSAINLRMGDWFSWQLYLRTCGKLGTSITELNYHGMAGKSETGWFVLARYC
jgi:hypothetical protein